MYRLQRYFYDATRKFYLLGRDRLLDEIDVRPGESILEVGCGTARNLIVTAQREPMSELYGLDASSAMLETAERKLRRSNIPNVRLETALADKFAYDTTFGREKAFDKIFFSYSISMIPPWKESLQNALKNLQPSGSLFIVDFYDQADLPALVRRALVAWLRAFQVRFWEDLIPFFQALENDGKHLVEMSSLYRRYSFVARIQKLP